MKVSKTTTPFSTTNWQYYQSPTAKGHPKYWVILEEKNNNLPQSELMRFRLGAKDKKEADKKVKEAEQFFPADIRSQLNIRIEKAQQD